MLDLKRFLSHRPTLFHVTRRAAWPLIQKAGLLCTRELLERAGCATQHQREAIREARLSGSYALDVPMFGKVHLRDQKPLIRAGLQRALAESGMSDQEWVDLLNDHVYFTSTQKASGTLPASGEAPEADLVLTVDARLLFERYAEQVRLCTFNPGYALRSPVPRSARSFQKLADFSGSISAIKEIAVRCSLPEIVSLLRVAPSVNTNGRFSGTSHKRRQVDI